MCGRFTMVTFEEMLAVARQVEQEARARQLVLPLPEIADEPQSASEPARAETLFPELEPVVADAFPSSVVPVVAPTRSGLQVVNLTWGFRVPWNKGPVFNARLETATAPGRTMWGDSLQRRRCLVASRGFFEPSATETVESPRTGRPVKRQYRFTFPHDDLLFLAAIYEGDSFSIVTCEPNRWVAPIHPRMPIALLPGEAPLWLSADYPQLFDRSNLELIAQ